MLQSGSACSKTRCSIVEVLNKIQLGGVNKGASWLDRLRNSRAHANLSRHTKESSTKADEYAEDAAGPSHLLQNCACKFGMPKRPCLRNRAGAVFSKPVRGDSWRAAQRRRPRIIHATPAMCRSGSSVGSPFSIKLLRFGHHLP